MLCDVVITVITCAVVIAGADVVSGCIHNNVACTIVAGHAVGQLPQLPLLPRLLMSKVMLLGAVELVPEGMVPVVL